MFSATLNMKDHDHGTLQLKGTATIEFCSEMRDALIDALNKTECLVVDVSRITELDVSALQLFCSARRSAIKRQKGMSLADGVSPEFATAVLDAGFNRSYTASCWHTAGIACLWGDCTPAGKQVTP